MIEKYLGLLSRFLELLCALFFVLMGTALTLQIFSRYFMSQSIFWAEEAARYAMVWLVYLGVVVAASHGSHTRIDFFVELLPSLGYRTVKVLVNIACLLFLAGIVYYSWDILRLGMILKSSAMRIPMIIVYSAIPLCCALTGIYLVRESAHIIKGNTEKKAEEVEP
jgi:TRAP-type C4-dicarboxylate transport system permease small subunit